MITERAQETYSSKQKELALVRVTHTVLSMQETHTQQAGERTQTPDEQNAAIGAQVDAEMPRPLGGFRYDTDEERWREARDARFQQLMREMEGR